MGTVDDDISTINDSLIPFTEKRFYGRGALMTKGTDEYFDFELHRYAQPNREGDDINIDLNIMLRPSIVIDDDIMPFESGIAKWLLPLGSGTRPSGHAIIHHIWKPGY